MTQYDMKYIYFQTVLLTQCLAKNARSKEEMVVCRVSGCVDREGNQKTMKRCSYKRHLINVHPTENASDPRGFCEKKQTVLSFGNAGGQRQQGLRRESGEGQGIERELSQDRSFR